MFSATKKYHHNFTAFIERFNKTFAKQLFKDQDAQELQNPTEDSKIWVKYLQKAVTRLNSEKTRMLGMTPAKAVKLMIWSWDTFRIDRIVDREG